MSGLRLPFSNFRPRGIYNLTKHRFGISWHTHRLLYTLTSHESNKSVKFLTMRWMIWCLIFSQSYLGAQDMNNEKMAKILYVVSDTLQGNPGLWQFTVGEVAMMCVTDQVHNRMRIISPIKEVKETSEEQLQAAMEANFHSALDVRYAISDDLVWVAFIHPLKELSKEQVIEGISQVYNGAKTFGGSYSSTELAFPKRQKKELKTKKS